MALNLRKAVLYLTEFICLFVIGVCIWLASREPLSALPKPVHGLAQARSQSVVKNGRRLEHVVLEAGDLGSIGLMVDLPDPLPKAKLPVLIVLGGLGTGENNIRMIEDEGENAIIGYDWPIPVDLPQGAELLHALPKFYHQSFLIPGQVASAIDWLLAQPWADNKRLSVLGYSLGALAAPAIENLAQNDGHPVGWTILAYGGAPLGSLFAANPHIRPLWLRTILGPVIDLLLHPLEPAVNLKGLSSHFLVLEGRDDALMPALARKALRDAVPEPKDVITFGGDHMGVGPDKAALLQSIIMTSRHWLLESGACNFPDLTPQ